MSDWRWEGMGAMRAAVLVLLVCGASLLASGGGTARGEVGEVGAVTSEVSAVGVPPALTEYMGRRIAQTMHWLGAEWLIRNRREREESAEEMREQLGLEPGMVVCDMGAGNGYHSLPMAEMVGEEGMVWAVDIQPQMLQMLRERAAAEGVENVKTVLGELHDPRLPEGVFDLIVLVDVYHEFSHPEQMLAGMRAALKEGGRMVLVEYRAEDETVPIKPEHKMSKEQIEKEMVGNGFRQVASYEELPWQHMVFYEREG